MTTTRTTFTLASSSVEGRQTRTPIAWIRQYPVISYFVIAFGLSWGVWVPMALVGARVDEGQAWPTHAPGLFGPIAAAFIMSAGGGDIGTDRTRLNPRPLPLGRELARFARAIYPLFQRVSS